MYRPHFPYATPEKYIDRDFGYSFDFSNVNLLNQPATGAVFLTQNIELPLQPDEVFMWRGIKVITYSTTGMPFYIQFRDPAGNNLSLAPVPIAHIALPSGAVGWGFAPVPIEPEIPCPAGSNILCNLQNPTVTASTGFPRILLLGVKRGPLISK